MKKHISAIYVCVLIIVACYVYQKILSKKALAQRSKKSISWADIQFQSGDLLLFSGTKSHWYHSIFKVCLWSPVHHVGVVFVNPYTGVPYVWELFDTGVYIMPLKDVNLRSIKYSVAVRQWNKPGVINPHWMYQFMQYQYLQKKPFNFDFPEIIKRRALKQLEKRKEDDEKITCAKFVAEIYQHAGLFENDYNAALLLPSDYMENDLPYTDKEIHLLEPITIGDLHETIQN